MNFTNYLKTWSGARAENRHGRMVITALAFTVAVLSVAVFRSNPVVVLMPPGLTEKGMVYVDDASDSVREAWGTFFADQLGNVTPRTADFLDAKLSRFVTPSLSNDLRRLIANQTKIIKDEQVTVQFSPTQVFTNAQDKVVVVSGEYTVQGLRGQATRTTKTFEFGISVKNYHIALSSLDLYEGPWAPRAARLKKEAQLKAEKAKRE